MIHLCETNKLQIWIFLFFWEKSFANVSYFNATNPSIFKLNMWFDFDLRFNLSHFPNWCLYIRQMMWNLNVCWLRIDRLVRIWETIDLLEFDWKIDLYTIKPSSTSSRLSICTVINFNMELIRSIECHVDGTNIISNRIESFQTRILSCTF